MAGERLARQTLFVTQANLTDGAWIDVWLLGAYRRFTGYLGSGTSVPTGTPNQFQITTTANAGQDALQRFTVQSFMYAVQQFLLAQGGTTAYVLTPVMGFGLASFETAGCLLVATAYDAALDFQLPVCRQVYTNGSTGFSWFPTLENTIRPVQVAQTITPAGIFGTATGRIDLVASNGTDGVYGYTWGDGGPATASRTALPAGAYACTVRDTSGASTQVTAVVGQDARLDVLLTTTGNVVALVVSGGRAPYAYAWNDGLTTPTRTGLAVGTYTCTVTDAVGASRQVSVVVEPYRFYWSKNAIALALDAGPAYRLDPTTKPNLSFLCEVYVEPAYLSGAFVQVGAASEQPADRAGRTTFEVQALLDAYVAEHLPDLNQHTISRADALFRRFYLRYTERFGEPAVTSAAFSTQAQHFVVQGGLDFFEAAAGTWFGSYQAGAQPFLTWEPNDKRVLPAQPEYLYFMVNSFALDTFQQRVRLRYADGSTQERVQETRTGAARYEVYCLPAGFAQLGLTLGAAVVGWDVYVTDAAGVPVSEVRRYLLDTSYVPEEQQRFFLYANSLGGVSTFACRGQAKRTLDVKEEAADRALPAGYDALLGDVQVLEKVGQPVLAVSSGPLRREQLLAAQDLALSRRVVLQRGGQYWPGKLKPQTVPVADEAEALPVLEFEFWLPRQRQFAPRLPVSAAGRPVVPISGGEGAQP
ncbi:hypothetical protein [Hymenobacter terricola]|uniref:hypothetical protein n=1 Tax=Hymenobacter terricola TaxID=2819236 RepID=UPI001B314808|nr:hypothetical protein [Hymenobacter terricola]